MKDWLASLEERERIMVLAAGGFILFALLYFGLWRPLDYRHERTAASVEVWRSSLQQLRPLRFTIQSGAGTQRPLAGQNQSLVVIVDNTLRQRNLYSALQRSQPTANNGIRVELENAAFDDLMSWLAEVDSTYGLQVQSGNFSRGAGPGRVNSSLTLER